MPQTTSELRANPTFQYKIKALLYDLANISKDRASEQRTLATTDELYISAPYFSPEEASCVRSALVDSDLGDAGHEQFEDNIETHSAPEQQPQRLDEAIQSRLASLF